MQEYIKEIVDALEVVLIVGLVLYCSRLHKRIQALEQSSQNGQISQTKKPPESS